jgi:hypothetical protein
MVREHAMRDQAAPKVGDSVPDFEIEQSHGDIRVFDNAAGRLIADFRYRTCMLNLLRYLLRVSARYKRSAQGKPTFRMGPHAYLGCAGSPSLTNRKDRPRRAANLTPEKVPA